MVPHSPPLPTFCPYDFLLLPCAPEWGIVLILFSIPVDERAFPLPLSPETSPRGLSSLTPILFCVELPNSLVRRATFLFFLYVMIFPLSPPFSHGLPADRIVEKTASGLMRRFLSPPLLSLFFLDARVLPEQTPSPLFSPIRMISACIFSTCSLEAVHGF